MTSTTAQPPDNVVDSWPALHDWRRKIAKAAGPRGDRLLALHLAAQFANEKHRWEVWPSQGKVAAQLGEHVRHTRERFARLVTAGWLTPAAEQRKGTTVRYALTFPPLTENVLGPEYDSDKTVPPPRTENVRPPRTENVRPPRTKTVRGGAPNPPPDSPRTAEARAEGRSDGLSDGSSGADPARAHARPVAPPSPSRPPKDDPLDQWAAISRRKRREELSA